MKIGVIIPSQEYATHAGARIRYRRLMEPLRRHGHELSLRIIDRFESVEDMTDDVYLVSKCHDAGAVLLAHRARAMGRLVGVDLFDDYFSQKSVSRFASLRQWLVQMLHACDFAVCSTPVMQAVVDHSGPNRPTHVMNDPGPSLDVEALTKTLTSRQHRVATTGRLNVAWFGIGDNPHFSAGLSDLVAFSDDLARLRHPRLETRLRILTNRRAMTSDTIHSTGWLPLPFEIDEWSEEAEARLLEESDIAFLPVNAQPFSVAKSLNRAVTALCAGLQVLSVGYPLYAALEPFIYRDPTVLVEDLERGSAYLRAATVDGFTRVIADRADPNREADGLATFLSGLDGRVRKPCTKVAAALPLLAVVHGRKSPLLAHKLALRLGALSVGTPFSKPDVDYDATVRLKPSGEGLEMLVRDRFSEFIEPVMLDRMNRGSADLQGWFRLDLAAMVPDALVGLGSCAAAQSSASPLVFAECVRGIRQVFRPTQLVLSDDDLTGHPLPDGFVNPS